MGATHDRKKGGDTLFMTNSHDKTDRMSLAEWKELHAKPKRKSKYNAQSTVVDGVHFPSKLEAAVWCQLLFLRKLGEFTNILRYPSIKLPGGVVWKADFKVFNAVDDRWEIHEAKGLATSDYRVKRKLYEEFGTMPLIVWKGSYKKPYPTEPIFPKNFQTTKE